jgi:hypothetical protein
MIFLQFFPELEAARAPSFYPQNCPSVGTIGDAIFNECMLDDY